MTNRSRGAGSLRERRPGVWELRVALGPDLVSGRSLVRSVTVHGDRDDAHAALARWAARAEVVRAGRRAAPGVTVADLLDRWVVAPHGWRPATSVGYRSTVRALRADPIGTRRASQVTPPVLRAVVARWAIAGVSRASAAARVRCLRSALGWAYREGVLDVPPLRGMRGPSTGPTRLHAPVDAIRRILRVAAADVAQLRHHSDTRGAAGAELHRREQVHLLARLAADTGARRGELAALQLGDLDGNVLTISRATSNEVVGPTKSGRIRRLTLGDTTAALWRASVAAWTQQALPDRQDDLDDNEHGTFGPWLFSRRLDHTTRLSTGCAGHWFADLAARARHPDVTLHRLRHTVATVLVGQGDILQAQHRLGHHDAATTLRIYSHALPLTDAQAAQTLDSLFR
ncbi:tyrosine-type recombinase/integrase [Pseudonocardia sp.]|uniref:tyrosine-type recombinase/integrase n=1 Tax=Pseudonocardia sp. TaxID=60912 RepID=UPI003D0BCE0E